MREKSQGSTPIQLLLVLVTLTLVGFTIDYVRVLYYQARLNSSLDLSLLASDDMIIKGSYGGLYELMKINVDSEFKGLETASDWQSKIKITDITASAPDPKAEGVTYLNFRVEIPFKTYFMSYFGFKLLNLTAETILKFADLPPVTAISTSSRLTCAISLAKDVWCWGSGYPNVQKPADIIPYKIPIGRPVKAVSVNGNAGCAITDEPAMNSKTYCWNRLVNASGTDDVTKIPQLGGATKLSFNNDIKCALKANGKVECWSEFSQNGQRGNGTASTTIEPTWPPTNVQISDVKDIGTAYQSACAITNSGQLYCWGDNARGELANGFFQSPGYTDNYWSNISFYSFSSGNGPNPVSPYRSLIPVGPATGVTNADRFINAGGMVHFRRFGLLTSDGRGYGWGNNQNLVLDLPAITDVDWAFKPESSAPIQFATSNIQDGVLTNGCLCLRTKDDLAGLKCRGINLDGCAGDNNIDIDAMVSTFNPVKNFWTGIPFKLSDGNSHHICVIDQNLVPWCWGRNASGSLGYGSIEIAEDKAPIGRRPRPIVKQNILYAL